MPPESVKTAPDDLLPPNYQSFPDGSLLRIVFDNFLTYEHTSFVPTANLNMILGHNGSGKSSIICGICLACGGSPKSLGRSEKIAEYVRHGCTEAYVEIAIADSSKGPQIIRLTIRVGKSPEYRLNGEPTTQTELAKLRKHYNIQIDNPCAFLAQDKVKSFSEQSSVDLLRNTEKAASDDLSIQHEGLIGQRTDSMTIEDKCTTAEKAVKRLETEIVALEPFVENYRKKLALQTRLRLLEKKMAFLEFEKADSEFQQEKVKMDEAMGEYRDLENEIRECEEKIKEFSGRVSGQKKNIQKLIAEADRIYLSLENSMDKKKMHNAIEKAQQKLNYAREASEKHEKKLEEVTGHIEATKQKLEAAEADYVGIDDFVKRQQISDKNYETITKDIRLEEDGIQKMAYQMRSLEAKQQEEMREVNDNRSQRFRALQAFSNEAARAWSWYDKNREQFRGKIYVPMMDMTLNLPESAKALENSVGIRDRLMFVCEFKEDEQRINGNDKSWRINTSVVSKHELREEDIVGRISPDLKRIGFKFLVSECFDAPPELKQYLCNVAGLSNIPWGGAEVERNAERVVEELSRTRHSVFLSDSLRCQVSRSKYSGEVIQSQSAMRDARTFRDQCFRKAPRVNTNVEEIRERVLEMQREIEEHRRKLDEKKRAVQKERDILRNEQIQWKSKNQIRMKWERELGMHQNMLRKLESENFDVDKAEKELERIEQAEREATMKMFAHCVEDHEKLKEKNRKIAIAAVIERFFMQKTNKVCVELDDARHKLSNLEDVKQDAERQLKSALTKKKHASETLKAVCQLRHFNVDKMEESEKRIFGKLTKLFDEGKVPTELDALDDEINSERTRLRMAEEHGEDGSIEHEQKSEQLKLDLEAEKLKREKLVENRTKLHQTLETSISEWRVEVEAMIEKINENYEKYFRELACRGEVSLEVPENTLDIEKYGIMINVCFRAGERMKRLDNRVQSGGERSVATMLYLLALQQLCPVPFRCIDEINQGMDPTNERKVFDIMVGLWNGVDGKLSKTQYFLLSPKLLHGLDMRENVNIVMVNSTLVDHHGKNYDTQSKLDAALAHLELNA